jgi:3-deoxy-D-manno-octulosonic-acid transferase
MNPLYNFAITAYAFGARVAATRSKKVKTMLEGQRMSLEHVASCRKKCAPSGFDLWFHAASLGEFEQARPLIEKYRAERPELKILLTFFSPSGYEVRKNYKNVDCVAYLPFDKPALVTKFLDAAQPHCAIFVKYEFWGNYLQQLHERHIPTYIISAIFRRNQIFFKWTGGMFRKMLHCYNHLFVQDDDSRALLASIGVDNVTVAGDTRFDRVTDIMSNTFEIPAIANWTANSPFTLVVGSSWQPDEMRYSVWLNSHPDVKAIIAPHEFDAQRLQTLQQTLSGKSVLWSQVKDANSIPADAQTLIIDCFGLLSSLYRYGNAALIGGGFGAGIHNINEAAVYGIPVIFGPKHQKFKEAADLIACKGGFCYHADEDLARILDNWLANPDGDLKKSGEAAAKYIKENLGATQTIYNFLEKR